MPKPRKSAVVFFVCFVASVAMIVLVRSAVQTNRADATHRELLKSGAEYQKDMDALAAGRK